MSTSQNFKQLKKYGKGVTVKFHYYYEDKIGQISEVLENNKYFIRSNNIEYPVAYDKIYGKIIDDAKEEHSGANEGCDNVPEKE